MANYIIVQSWDQRYSTAWEWIIETSVLLFLLLSIEFRSTDDRNFVSAGKGKRES